MANDAGGSTSGLPQMHRPSLPVHLTWKGVEIFFPTVVLGADLKEKADAAFNAKQWKDSGKAALKQSEVKSDGTEGYACIICGKKVLTKSGLLKHMTIHNPAPATAGHRFGPCEKCGGVFSKSSRLSAHLLICKGKKLEGSMPDLSANKYATNSKRDSPSKSEDSEEDYIIQVPVVKTKHIKKEIPELQVKTCLDLETDDEANEESDSDSNGLDEEEESKERRSNCRICKVAFRKNENVRSHEKMCPRMLEKFDSRGKERKYHCTSCPWKFLSLRSLQNHQITHLDEKPYKCSLSSCKERFTRADNLNKHMARAHSGHDGKLYSCGKCNARFDSTDLLIKHVEVCKTLPSNTYIDESVDLTNASTKNVTTTYGHSCAQCGRKFRRALDLRNHEQVHETTKGILQKKLSKHLQKSKRAQLAKRKAKMSDKNLDKNYSSTEQEKETPTVSDTKSVQNEDSKSSSSKAETVEFNCDACGAGFADKISLSRHCLSHVLGGISEQIGNKPSTFAKGPSSCTQDSDSAPSSAKALYYECRFPNCTHGFSHDEDLWFHIEKKHKTPFNHCCDKCGLDCLSEVIYSEHKQSAHGQFIEMADVNPSIDDIDIKMEDYRGANDDYGDDADQESDYHEEQEDVRDTGSPCKDIRIDYASICSRKPVIEISADLKSRADAAAKSYEVINLEEDEVINIEDDEVINIEDEVVHVEGDQVINIENDRHRTSHPPAPTPKRNRTPLGSNKDSDSDFVVEDHQDSEDDSDPDFDPSSENIPKTRKKVGHSSFMSDETCYKCELCCKVFYEVSKFSAHMDNHEFAKERGRVWSNSTTFRRRTNLRADVPIQDTYSCEQCKKTYDDRKSYICHLNYHDWMKRQGKGSNVGQRTRHRDDIPFQDIYTCEKCNETFSVRINFVNHVNYHEKMLQKGIEWTTGSGRKRFREDIPLQDVYTCSLCVHNGTAKTFENRNEYLFHVNYHAKMKAKGIEWTWTPPEPNQQRKRPSHFRKDIPIQDVYTCSMCPLKSFESRNEYILHANYHDKMREKGIDWKWTPQRNRRGPNSPRFRDDIPFQDVYTCSICPLKAFQNRTEYIMHANYHDKMREKGIDWKWTPPGNRRGPNSPRYRDDIPFQDTYTCSICSTSTDDQTPRTFTNRMSFINHLNYHKGRNSMSPFSHRGRFRSDIPLQDVYTCSLCDDRKEFTARNGYIRHLYYHEISRNWVMKGSKAKRKGRRSDIPFMDEYTCNLCRPERTFTSRNSYISHYQYHKLIAKSGYHRPIKQLRWKNKYHTVSKLRQETASKQGSSTSPFSFQEEDIPIEENYSCNLCNDNTTFTDRDAYKAHLNSHDSSEKEEPRQYEETSSDEAPRHRASNAKVPIQRVYRCKFCSEIKTFTERSKFLNHLNYHRNKRKELDSISAIPSGEEGDDSLDGVSIARIPIQDTYRCKLCQEERVFTKRFSYARHLRRHQLLKDKTFQCLLCEKAFSSAWNLSTHSRTHTGEKVHICGDCGKRFSTNGSLKKHTPKCLKIPCKYTCHCGEKFHAVASLQAHQEKFHKDENSQDIVNLPSTSNSKKSFHCYVCKQEFGTPSELDFHVQREHNQDYIEFMMQRPTNKTGNIENTDKECDTTHLNDDKESPIGSEHDDESNLEMLQPICEIQVKNENEEIQTQEDSNEITIPPPSSGWNFIPELENKDDDEEEDNQLGYEDFSPETFEPEEVEVGDGGIPSLYEEIQVEESPAFNYSSSEGHHENSPMRSSRAEKSVEKKSRIYKKDGCYKCGYCDKKSHRVPYIKVHCNRIHSGLPFRYEDLSSNEIAPKKKKPGSATATSSRFDAHPKPSSSRQQQTQSVIERVKQKIMASETSHSGSNSSSQNSKTRSILPKKSRTVRSPCGCSTVDDSALGLLKRCTGSGCPCYFNYKGCGEGCSCSTVCSNPFFRRRDSNEDPSKKDPPGLLPVSFVPVMNHPSDVGPTYNIPSNNFSTNTLTFMVSTPSPVEVDACSNYQVQDASPIIINSPMLNSLLVPQPDNLFKDAEVAAFRVIPSPGQRPELNTQLQQVLTTVAATSSMICVNQNGAGFGEVSMTPNESSELRQSTGQMNKPILVSKEYFSQLIATLDVHESHVAFLRLLRCNYCLEDDFANFSAYLRHLWKHRSELTFYCPICITSFPLLTLLLLHARTHTKLPDRSPVSVQSFCPVCSASFENEVMLRWHVETLHLPVNCGICHEQFTNEAMLSQHEGRDHKEVTTVSCSLTKCLKTFPTTTALAMHLYRNHKKCEICSTFYQDTDALKDHIMSNHGGKRHPSINTTVCNVTDDSFMGYPTIVITNTPVSNENNITAPVLQSYYNSLFGE